MEVDASDDDFEDAHDTFNDDDDDIFEVGSVRRPEPLSKFCWLKPILILYRLKNNSDWLR